MEVHPQSPPPMRGCALQWTPAEELEDGLEARLLLWHGRKIGLAFHSSRGGVPQAVLLGPVAEALDEPDGWLDGLDASAVLDRLEDALRDLPIGRLEEALASYAGCAHSEGPGGLESGQAAPGTHPYSPIAR